jgi:drug/metabolite transporter (DMT)-like permease
METVTKIPKNVQRIVAIGESVLATTIWASSFVFVKIGLEYMGPLTIAGFRYFLAFLILLPFLIRKGMIRQPISRGIWLRLFAIGISAYTVGNGALFWGLKYLPATTVSFLMSLSPLLILIGGAVWLKEIPTRWQVFGIVVSLSGSVLFFSSGLKSGEPVGIVIVIVGLIGFMLFGILGREIAKVKQLDTITLTTIPLAIGGGFLLLLAFPLEGMPLLSTKSVGIVLWLAIVNTALAYILYNHSLQILTALEMNVMLNLTPLGTALLAWWLLGERLGFVQIIGMVVMIIGVIFVQRTHNNQSEKAA